MTCTEEHPAERTLDSVEKEHVERVITHFRWNRVKAAASLGVARSTLAAKLRKYGLDRRGAS